MQSGITPKAALALITAGSCCAAAPSALASGITTVHIDMPTAPLGFFGQQYTQDFLQDMPDEPMQLVELRLNVNFNTDASIPFNDAADILFEIQPPTQSLPFWQVSGEDLAWSGQGAFSGQLSTTAFNEPLIFDPDADFLLWFFRILSANDQNPQLGGQLTDSYWEADLAPIPTPGAAGMIAFAGLASLRRRRR